MRLSMGGLREPSDIRQFRPKLLPGRSRTVTTIKVRLSATHTVSDDDNGQAIQPPSIPPF